MAKTTKPFWIKQRNNPQLGTYYVAMGRMSKTAAKGHGKSIYGSNKMLEFATEAEYKAKIEQLKSEDARIQGE